MKKGLAQSVIFAGLVTSLFLFSVHLVSAQTLAEDFGREAARGLSAFMEQLRLNPTNMSVILLGILLWIIVYSIVVQLFKSTTKTGTLFAFAVSVIVVILTFISLPQGFVEAIVLQYGAMGAAILVTIPFIILLYFSIAVTNSLLIARLIWVFYVLYYLGIFAYKIGTLQAAAAKWFEYIPYGISILGGIIIIITLKDIRRFWFKGKLKDIEEKGIKTADKANLLHRLQSEELQKGYG
ncbi:hypothetical protein J4402_00680 [Candidatus Pacearchaeota archaeon]|nr:hypothetical protein [Candidatus Pacearchaeota archaeon]